MENATNLLPWPVLVLQTLAENEHRELYTRALQSDSASIFQLVKFVSRHKLFIEWRFNAGFEIVGLHCSNWPITMQECVMFTICEPMISNPCLIYKDNLFIFFFPRFPFKLLLQKFTNKVYCCTNFEQYEQLNSSRIFRMFHFSIDRGGTFTDVLVKEPSGCLRVMKLLSVNPEYEDAPREAIR